MEDEPPDRYAALIRYAEAGSARSLPAVAAVLKVSTRTVIRWSVKWNWRQRIGSWDLDQAKEETRTTHEIREAVKERIAAETPRVLERLVAWLTAAETKASTGIPGALRFLELAGFTPPKRIELDVDDRRERAIEAAAAELELLTPEQLAALDAAIGEDPAPASEDAGV